MTLKTWYGLGTISVTGASTAVTGSGTSFLTAGAIKAGDYLFANGLMMPIAAVNSNSSLTLEAGWPGSTIAAGAYYIVPAGNDVGVIVAARAALDLLLNGTLSSLAGLTTANNKAPYFTGEHQAALHDQTAFGRAIQNLTGANGSFIRATGASAAVMQAIVGTVSQTGGTMTGALVERGSNSNGQYTRWADGTQICFQRGQLDQASSSEMRSSYSFPASFATGTKPRIAVTPGIWDDAGGNFDLPGSASTVLSGMGYIGQSVASDLTHNGCSVSAYFAATLVSGNKINVNILSMGRWF